MTKARGGQSFLFAHLDGESAVEYVQLALQQLI